MQISIRMIGLVVLCCASFGLVAAGTGSFVEPEPAAVHASAATGSVPELLCSRMSSDEACLN